MLRFASLDWKLIFLICAVLSLIIPIVAADEPVTINKPRNRVKQPWVQINKDHVRCFCNLPPCVATGYMCKSSGGGCFSDLLESRSSTYKGRHGCIEYLPESQRSRCPSSASDKDGLVHIRKKEHPRALLVCCSTDLCNHVDNPTTRNLINSTLGEDDPNNRHQKQGNFLYTNSEVWFRAATIAVPICGAVILFVLIALAVKILKRENPHSAQNKLGPTMYMVPSDQKHVHKWGDYNYKQFFPRHSYFSQAHPSTFSTTNQEDSLQRHFEIPLLVTNEVRNLNNITTSSNTISNNKNTKR